MRKSRKARVDITNWLKGDIAPLQWGDSAQAFIDKGLITWKDVNSLKKRRYPYLTIEFVEFYFDDDTNYSGLNEIIVTVFNEIHFNKRRIFTLGWVSRNKQFAKISTNLNEQNIKWEIEYGHAYNTPNIKIGSSSLLAFDPYRIVDQNAELMKIYLKRNCSANMGMTIAG